MSNNTCSAFNINGEIPRSLVDLLSFTGLKQFNYGRNSLNRTLDLVLSNADPVKIKVERCSEGLVNEDTFHPTLSIELSTSLLRFINEKEPPRTNFFRADYDELEAKMSTVDWRLVCGENRSAMSDLVDFQRIEKIGQGTYGVVYKATDVKTKKFVALKKIRLESLFVNTSDKIPSETEGIPSTAIREIALLKDIKHHSIVQLFDVIISDTSLYMVFEFLEMDLKKMLENGKDNFTPSLVK
ncbi:Cyclin-dependent kinase 2, partial [Pseudolycoriella hygida]